MTLFLTELTSSRKCVASLSEQSANFVDQKQLYFCNILQYFTANVYDSHLGCDYEAVGAKAGFNGAGGVVIKRTFYPPKEIDGDGIATRHRGTHYPPSADG
ncbi:hypothetical protein A1OQ_12685 [Enterovibrio norvegicus FF-162]|nr:hypothetical protein A1OQ_12685 [Enterovibrio norvegicus FF-162]